MKLLKAHLARVGVNKCRRNKLIRQTRRRLERNIKESEFLLFDESQVIVVKKISMGTALYMALRFHNLKVFALFDTGSPVTLIQKYIFDQIPETSKTKIKISKRQLKSISGDSIGVVGESSIAFFLGSELLIQRMIILEDSTHAPPLLVGLDLCIEYSIGYIMDRGYAPDGLHLYRNHKPLAPLYVSVSIFFIFNFLEPTYNSIL